MPRRSFWWLGLLAIALVVSVSIGHLMPSHGLATPAPFQISQADANGNASDSPVTELAISGTYEDSAGTFQVAILEGYSVDAAAGSPLFQNGDGSLAYSVVQVPLTGEATLSDIGLVEVVQQTLGRGEGFQTQTFTTLPGGGIQIAWTGRLTQGTAPPQPVSGTILAKQEDASAYLLIVAALADAEDQIPLAVSTLVDTLTIL